MIAAFLYAVPALTGQAQTEKTKQNETPATSGKIVVYYFHNIHRCTTCQAVEAITRKTLEDTFQQQMKTRETTFQSLNIEEDVNKPLAHKLHVSGQTLLFVKDGKKKDLSNTTFMYARSNSDKLKAKIVSAIEKL